MAKKSNTFEIIVIILLLVMIVYMMFKLHQENLESTSDSTSDSTSESTMQLPVELPVQSQDVEKKVRFDLPESNSLSNSQAELESKQESVEESIVGNDDISSSSPREVNAFLDEYINYSRFTNKPPELISSKEDINAYRQSYLDFNNMINRTSSGFDPVDRMNENIVAKAEANGMSVSEVYDRIASSNFDTSNIDLITMQHVAEKKTDNGKYLDINKIQYKDDNVNNGGFFFEKVEGSDERLNERYMTL
jgi:hypothetical protein